VDFDKEEVEKLVGRALNEKMLRKMDIKNLAQLDKVSSLEKELAKCKRSLKAAESRTQKLEAKLVEIARLANEP
jgi:chaperonin cofactor prefoldin